GVHTGVHYPVPVHLQPAYASLGLREGTFPVSEGLARTSMSLPMYPELGDEQLSHVSECVREFFIRGGSTIDSREPTPAGL
ncbi:MAG: DegT/DnrJ/EryC1/StrS family aminotransferase, partial [Gaiellaceae bacterium]